MNSLNGKRILVGVTGGIAAYKSAELVRRLREQCAEVSVVMTRSACEFITPLTMQALSGKPVHTELLDHNAEAGMGHIELARWCDTVVIAPASANFIARLSQGIADDLLSTLCLATSSPLLVAPAMNQQMWVNPATQHNIQLLNQRGISLLGPVDGEQACGDIGPGRMLEPHAILQSVEMLFNTDFLSGKSVLITAGPTREAIDPVRYLSNRSSGRMGYAIAQAAQEAGANVSLVSGPVSLVPPQRVKVISVNTAAQMREAVLGDAEKADIFISAAAVADYRCAQVAAQKIKKNMKEMILNLEKTPDILAEVAALNPAPFTVGFAAETESVSANAREKLNSKKLDMIAVNQVGEDLGFEAEDNALELLWREGGMSLQRTSKKKLARQLIQIVAEQYYNKNSNQSH